MMKRDLLVAAAVVFGLAVGAGRSASANLLPGQTPDYQIVVTSDVGGDRLTLNPTSTQTPGGLFVGNASGTEPSFSFSTDFALTVDPNISGSFTLTNLSGITQVFTVSASMTIAPFPGPTTIDGSFGDATYTDANGDSSVEFATSGSDPFFSALIDGVLADSRGKFDEPLSGGPGIFGTHSKEAFGPESGPAIGIASNFGVAFKFSVTPGDSVQTPFEFNVVSAPEPEFLPIFATGIALFLCTLAQESASRGK